MTNLRDNTKERPILFSAAEVRAVLAGTKSQMRLVVGLDTLSRSTGDSLDPKGELCDRCWDQKRVAMLRRKRRTA